MYEHKPKLKRSFYERDTLTVARELLGKRLLHESREGLVVGEIVETEAYTGPEDRASHAYGGRRTPRVEAQYGPKGHAYIYVIHAKCCFDITTGPHGKPEVVLIRALRPIYGIKLMAKRRSVKLTEPIADSQLRNLCNGIGKLCEAMGIDRRLYGVDLCGNALYLEEGTEVKPSKIAVTPRIGIDYAGKAKDYPWRFLIKDCIFVSKPVFDSE